MFDIFKKNKEIQPVEQILVADKSVYPKEVQDIHHEFENAGEKLLQEAYAIIGQQPSLNLSKIERLQKFGFKQVKENVEAVEVIKTIQLSESQIQLVKYYKKQYPFHKFITEEQVKTICHKYNLVCGGVERFTGFVPDKNLKEIENFKLKKEESNHMRFIASRYGSRDQFEITFENAEIRHRNNYYHIYSKSERSDYNYSFQSEDGIRFYGNDRKDIFGYASLGSCNLNIESSSFKICAPVKDMDISGLELKEGYKLQRKIEIPDPVVLQPVKGGYLIITAWGDEASDPLVLNENHN